MEKIKKGLNIKIMSLIIIVLFIFNNTALYGIPAYNRAYLRTPLLGNSDKGRARLEEAISLYTGIQGSIGSENAAIIHADSVKVSRLNEEARLLVQAKINELKARITSSDLTEEERYQANQAIAKVEEYFSLGNIVFFNAIIKGHEDYLLAFVTSSQIVIMSDFFTNPRLQAYLDEALFHEGYVAAHGERDYETHRAIYSGIQRKIFGEENPLKKILRDYIAIREIILSKERTLKITLSHRGYDNLDNRKILSEALDKEITNQQTLLSNTKMLFKMSDHFSLRYKMPTSEELASNADSVVETWQDESVLSTGTGKAQTVYIGVIANILEEQGFRGVFARGYLGPKDFKNIFDLGNKEQIGVLLRLPVYLRALIRKYLENSLGKKFLKEYPQFNGYILIEVERALIAIGKWMQENYQGTDYGIDLQALYIGLARPKDTADYLIALERILQMEKGLDILQERGFILERLIEQEQKSGNIPMHLYLDRKPDLDFYL